MKYILDTNIISDAKKNDKVISFLENIDLDNAFLSVITIGEIQKGIEKLEQSSRKLILQNWLEQELISNYKILSIDIETILYWGKLISKLNKQGKNMPILDSLIAATALINNCILVTRNEKDFIHIENLEIINPWNI